MNEPAFQPEVEELKAEIARLREENKERESSLLRAFKTLLEDYRAFQRGERAFPQSAFLGLLFAYLRPRIIIVLGSIGAVIFAGAQVWMLYRQNDLIERQNVLITGQSYALRAQTTAALLAGLDDAGTMSRSRLAMLSAFGDVGIESLLILARGRDQTGEIARGALASQLRKIDKEQAGEAFVILLGSHIEDFVNVAPDAEFETKFRWMNELARSQVSQLQIPDEKFIREFLIERGPHWRDDVALMGVVIDVAPHVPAWSDVYRRRVARMLVLRYLVLIATDTYSGVRALDGLCLTMNRAPIPAASLSVEMVSDLRRARQETPQASAWDVAVKTAERVCGVTEIGTSTLFLNDYTW